MENRKKIKEMLNQDFFHLKPIPAETKGGLDTY